MKKVLLFLSALILLSMITNAQGSSGKCFDENTKLLGIGVGLGADFVNYSTGPGYSYQSSPALSVTYEQTYPKRLGPGFLGVGAYLGFQGSSSKYENYPYNGEEYYYKHSYRSFIIASRGAYHWDGLIFEKGEVYGGVVLGLRIKTYLYTTNSPDPNMSDYSTQEGSTSVGMAYSVFAGARWYFKPKIGVFGEVSSGISYITGGVNFKI